MSKYSIIMTTTNSNENLDQIIKALLDARLAACLQYYPIKSAYVWKDEIQQDDETLLLIKTKSSLFSNIEKIINEVHSYEEPELIMIPIEDGSRGYLDWVNNVTKN